MQGLDGKVAIVTGGAQGIGRATVDRLVAEGVAVTIADVSDDYGKAAEAELTEAGGRVWYAHTDVADEESVIAAVTGTAEQFGRVDFLVNCAAVFIMRGLEATVDEWRRIMDVNIMGQALCVKHAAPHMARAGGGSIVNIASISGHIAQPGYLTYNATKAAVANMTRCMALDLADSGIRVNAVNPGTVWNANNERYHREELGLTRAQADQHPDIGGKHILKRTADPSEIASTIAFLLSAEASYVTGENLMVDGGYTAL
ncbi:glucose 1-dehydrogenase [Crossiella sp. CA-258035]|uniref:SDR family NAD(P)-dependent oxidoreductase n=1 Tax=Crossiella sp. CA-258035 TaxID=2981138 RepID=UPI0024BD3B5A|nr:glucose 1-dehydrogenase [Crossiella sp. CA-258035]WHT16371.1 glucose 1-dehydrogenase [Crossiella sp. CA-258035]